MSVTMRVTADPAAVSMAEAIRRLATSAPLFLVSHRAFRDLSRELGSDDRAARHIAEVAIGIGRPILVNGPTGGARSATTYKVLNEDNASPPSAGAIRVKVAITTTGALADDDFSIIAFGDQ
jgi:hypothetical protein